MTCTILYDRRPFDTKKKKKLKKERENSRIVNHLKSQCMFNERMYRAIIIWTHHCGTHSIQWSDWWEWLPIFRMNARREFERRRRKEKKSIMYQQKQKPPAKERGKNSKEATVVAALGPQSNADGVNWAGWRVAHGSPWLACETKGNQKCTSHGGGSRVALFSTSPKRGGGVWRAHKIPPHFNR